VPEVPASAVTAAALASPSAMPSPRSVAAMSSTTSLSGQVSSVVMLMLDETCAHVADMPNLVASPAPSSVSV
jgi:hypothetical protein